VKSSMYTKASRLLVAASAIQTVSAAVILSKCKRKRLGCRLALGVQPIKSPLDRRDTSGLLFNTYGETNRLDSDNVVSNLQAKTL
jgi:hypothetical protein